MLLYKILPSLFGRADPMTSQSLSKEQRNWREIFWKETVILKSNESRNNEKWQNGAKSIFTRSVLHKFHFCGVQLVPAKGD